MFITVEGIEGCGKSTLLAGLSERLRDRGRETIVTREPGGSPAGDAVRAIFLDPSLSLAPLTEALLINASRVQHVLETIEPALRRGAVVLCDRFVDSTLAYQGYGRGIALDLLRGMCDAATGGREPDATFILDVPIAISRARVASRRGGLDRLDHEADAFYERVRAGYLDLARSHPRYRVIDATKSAAEVLADALAAVEARIA